MFSNLNNEQKIFVNTKDKDVLVSASAGSGKTTTMIEKLKDLILNNLVPVENLLVVTFTEAAASEMKQKLYNELSKEISNQNFDEEKLTYFYEQLFQIANADIGTLHSVCKKIVSKYFYEVNVEPNFGILSNEEYLNLFNQALEKTFASYVETADEEFYEVYESFNDKRSDDKLKDIITKLYNFLSEKSEPEKYVGFVNLSCLNENVNENICCVYLLDYYLQETKKFLTELFHFENIINDEKLLNYLKELRVGIFTVSNSKNFEEFVKNINELNFPRLNKPKDVLIQPVFEQLKNSVDAFKEVVKKAKENCSVLTIESFSKITKKLSQIYNKLFEITFKTEQEFIKLKNDFGKLDFSDLQKYAYKILQNTTIREELKNNYKYIFVDEYQDINQIQEDILLCLSNNNLNMIGDVKQSIYAFRQCMPEIFLSKYYKFLNHSKNQLILLNKNYRCSKNVVDFVNMCFNTLITKNTVGIDYKNESQLILGSENSGAVGIKLIGLNTENTNENDESESIKKDEAEAVVVAQTIMEVYGKEYYDAKDKTNKNIDYKDIAILVRDAKDYVNTLYDVLKAHQIPVTTTLKTTLFNTIEIKPLVSILKIVNNVNSDLDICNVLLSPLFNLSLDELAEVKTFNKEEKLFNNIKKMLVCDKKCDLCDKLHKFIDFINTFKYKLNYLSIMEAVNWVVITYDLINYYKSLPNGNQMVENIKQFLMLLNNAGFDYNLNKCLEFLESLSHKDDFMVNVESGENSVKILTMHKSKGLEYPCVILSNLGKEFNKSTTRSDVILTNKLGMGINFKEPHSRSEILTIQKSANKHFEMQEQLQEQIRLLYVALTRARNFLFLTGCYNLKNFSKKYEKPIMTSSNFLDLFFKSLSRINTNGFINENENFDIMENKNSIASVQIFNIENISNTVKVKPNKIFLTDVSNQNVIKLLNNFEKIKPVEVERVATKNSVTGLMREDDYVNYNELNLKIGFSEKYDNNISLKIGNAYHLIMQKLSYKETEFEIAELINLLVKNGEIEKEVLPFVDVKKIVLAKNEVLKLITGNTKILKEQQFLLKVPYNEIVETSNNNQNILVQGVVDLVLINGSEAILIDFKTNKTKDISKLINAYSLQLNVYKKAVSEGLKVKVVSTKLYLFELGSFVEIV